MEGDIVHGAVLVGQSLNVLNDILPCAEVMERLIAEARDTLANAKILCCKHSDQLKTQPGMTSAAFYIS